MIGRIKLTFKKIICYMIGHKYDLHLTIGSVSYYSKIQSPEYEEGVFTPKGEGIVSSSGWYIKTDNVIQANLKLITSTEKFSISVLPHHNLGKVEVAAIQKLNSVCSRCMGEK